MWVAVGEGSGWEVRGDCVVDSTTALDERYLHDGRRGVGDAVYGGEIVDHTWMGEYTLVLRWHLTLFWVFV